MHAVAFVARDIRGVDTLSGRGRPTIITDLVHTVDIPAYDPRSWTLLHAPSPTTDGEFPLAAEPACVSIDLLDEDHSLSLAIRRLATDPRLRATLGRRGREVWAERFTLARMLDAYRSLIATALLTPEPDAARRRRVPAHFRVDGTEYASERLRELGLSEERIAGLWSPPS